MRKQRIKLLLKKLVYLFKLDVLIIPILLLYLVNIIVQYSATDKNISRLISDIFYLGISFVVMLIIAHLNINHIKILSKPLYIFSIILLILVLTFGIQVNGARRWLNVGVHIQPSEISKLAVPLLLSYYFSLRESVPSGMNFLKAFIILVIPCLLILKQPDLGTAILVFASGFYVMFFAGLSLRVIIVSITLLILSSPIVWHFLQSYQKYRILTLLNPQSDPLGKGYHIIQGIIAIGSGGFLGKGYLQGTQTHLSFIPEKSTDFVITVMAEEFGYLGVFIVLLLYFFIILRGLSIARNSDNIFSKTMAGSIAMSFFTYVVINMGMVSGVLPVVGIPLPLISYGGTATMVIMAEIGILLSIAQSEGYRKKSLLPY